MYLAELYGKLPSRIERMEDILTSNVFSFFKYSTREIFLKGYLNKLGFKRKKGGRFYFFCQSYSDVFFLKLISLPRQLLRKRFHLSRPEAGQS